MSASLQCDDDRQRVSKHTCICCQILSVAVVIALLSIGLLTCVLSDECSVTTAGVLERCDREARCVYTERDHSSWDFLCCEDRNGWVASHTTHPLLVYMFTGGYFTTAFAILFFETIEISLLLTFGSFIFFTTGNTDNETVAGILVGDAIFQGGYGLLIGLLLWYVFRQPPLLPDYFETRRNGHQRVFWKYVALWSLYAVSFMAPNFVIVLDETPLRELNIGFLIMTVFQLLLVWVFLPNYTCSPLDEHYVWRGYSRRRRRVLFGVWGTITLLLHVQTNGAWQYLANDYYQVWLSQWLILAVLSSLAAYKCCARRKRKQRRIKA